jgi:hypothetical protein
LHRTGGDGRQQLRGVGFGETREPHLTDTAVREMVAIGITDGDDEADAVREETTGDEGEHVGRFAVEPLRVVDDAQERLLRCHRREERQRRKPDHHPVDARGFFESERDPQRVALTGREDLELVHERMHELMQAGIPELHLGFDPDQAQHAQISGCDNRRIEQRSLADPGLAAHHQRGAESTADRVQEELDVRSFCGPPDELTRCHLVHPLTICQTAHRRRGQQARRRRAR